MDLRSSPWSSLSAPVVQAGQRLVGLLGFITAYSSPVGKVLDWPCHLLPCPFELPGLECAGSSALPMGACDPLGLMNLSFL